ncbi:MAG TPA: hypothetical protein V6D25_22160, partial [Leptolyngbyaceae cyanobacterium]
MLRLVKEPEKLREAVAIAVKENPSPSASDFATAAQKVVPRQSRPRIKPQSQEPLVPKNQEPMVPQPARVTVTSPDHPRHGESGTIEADPPNYWQQIVTFADGSRELINNADLDAPSVPFSTERTYPKEYAEAIAQLKQQHQQELERLEQELRIGLLSEAKAQAEQQVKEQLTSWQQLYQQQKEHSIQLQQRLDEMEALRQRNQELENAVQQRPAQEWGNTLTKQAAKALNKEVVRSLENTIDLRS